MISLIRFARSYLVALALVGVLAVTFIKSLAGVVEPVPQHPPEGITIVRDSEQLAWSPGKRLGPLTLQVSINDPNFSGKLVIDVKVKSDTFVVRDLKPGATYYWRLVQKGETSHVSHFHVALDAVKY